VDGPRGGPAARGGVELGALRFPFETPLATVLVRVDRPTGEWVLRRRPAGAGWRYEVILNGKLLMDSAGGESEAALAHVALARCGSVRALRVLVGGLGFGFTLRAALADPRVAAVEVVELEPALVDALAVPELAEELGPSGLGDPRVTLHQGDVRAHVAAKAGSFDCLLLDVDNGPGSLSAVGNEALYDEPGLRACRDALRPGGVLAIWSAEPAPDCLARLRAVFGDAEERRVPVRRDGRLLEDRILSARRP
jgi:spermidine synthase